MDGSKLLGEIIECVREGVYAIDARRRIVYWNRAAERITGHGRSAMLGKVCRETPLQHIDGKGNRICEEGCPLQRALISGEGVEHEAFLKRSDGERIPVSVKTTPLFDGGVAMGAVEVFSPISPTLYDDELITRLASSAMADPLTGIPNRRRAEGFLDFRLMEAARSPLKVCVLFMDIDNFGAFNNSRGHGAGDEMLRAVTGEITKITRSTDLFARWGGEEFVGIYMVKYDADAEIIAEKARATVEAASIEYEGERLSVTVSAGATIARGGESPESVVERADSLMYASKQAGKNRVTTDAAASG